MKFHAALARELTANGCETLFGLIGDANLFFADSFVRECGGAYYGAAHEVGAALAALGYSAVSGKLGVCTVTHGPGLANAVTALIEGAKGTLPMLLICGDTAITDRDNNQNIAHRELVLSTGAGFEQLRSPERLAIDLASAVRRAWCERRPIVLNVPANFQWMDVEYQSAPYKRPARPGAYDDNADLDDAIGVIAFARRPIVLAGRGAHDRAARDALRALAERIGAPLATTLKGKGSFRGDPFDLGICGTLASAEAVEVIASSDCIISFGASLDRFTTAEGSLTRGKRIVQVSEDAGEIGRLTRPDVGLVGDLGRIAERMIHWLDQAEIEPSGFRSEEMATLLAGQRPINPNAGPASAGKVDIVEALLRLDAMLPHQRTLVTDAGRFTIQAWRHMNVPSPDAFVSAVNFGSIGLGAGFALGTCAAIPDRPTVMVVGDGGFMLGGLAEFNTAVRHGFDLIVILCNDGGYGAEHIQFRKRGMDPALSLFDWPDFVDLGRSLGGDALAIRSGADFDAAATAIATRRRPLLIELRLDPDHIPPVK